MKKLVMAFGVCFLVTACGGGSNGSGRAVSAARNPAAADTNPESQSETQICYLGINSDHKTCLQTQPINAKEWGYLDPYKDRFMGTGDKEQYRQPQRAIVLKEYSQNLKLSPNFIMSELMSVGRSSIGIFAPAVVKALQNLRDLAKSAIRVNSSYRSPKYNAGVDGSATWSRHQYGDAFDISSKTLTLNQMVALCKQLGATYIDKYVVHIHCDWRAVPVPEGFYGKAPIVEDLKMASFSVEDAAIEMSETSVLHIDGQIEHGNVVYLSSEVEFKDDVEELYKKWEILTPSGQVLVYETPVVSLLLESGRYQIRHSIGEHAQVNQYFVVP